MLALLLASALAAEPKVKTAKEAFEPLGELIGTWKVTGKADDAEKTFWSEKRTWAWSFAKDDSWLTLTIDKGKHFTAGELRYDAKKDAFELTMTRLDKSTATYSGGLSTGKNKEPILTLERTDGDTVERFTVTLLHENRYLDQLSTKPKAASDFARQYQLGATKDGKPFAAVDRKKDCIVSGGRGTIEVKHKGTTYYVCCSGCKDEFEGDPEKYIKLAAEKKK